MNSVAATSGWITGVWYHAWFICCSGPKLGFSTHRATSSSLVQILPLESFLWPFVHLFLQMGRIVNSKNRHGPVRCLLCDNHPSVSRTPSPAVGILACKKGKGSKEQVPGVSSPSLRILPVDYRSGSYHSHVLSLLFVCSQCILSGSGTLPVQRALKVLACRDYVFSVYSLHPSSSTWNQLGRPTEELSHHAMAF